MTAKRCGVFDRALARRDSKVALDALWKIASLANKDISITGYQHGSLVCALRSLEESIFSLTLEYGSQALLPDVLPRTR
jgi:hypothetical protein